MVHVCAMQCVERCWGCDNGMSDVEVIYSHPISGDQTDAPEFVPDINTLFPLFILCDDGPLSTHIT